MGDRGVAGQCGPYRASGKAPYTNKQTLLKHHQTADAMKKTEGQVTE